MADENLMRLTSRVRLMINDTASPAVFDDDAIQDTLESHRHDLWFVNLRPLPVFIQGQPILYTTFVAEGSMGAISDGYRLQRVDYSELAGPSAGYDQVASFEPYPARWILNADTGEPAGIRGVAVRLTGYGYDLFAVSADLLRFWAAKLVLAYDFTEDKSTFNRSQQQTSLLSLASEYEKRAQATSSRLWQGDAQGDFGSGPSVVYPSVPSSGFPIP